MKRWFVLDLFIPAGMVESVSNFLMEQGAAGIEELEGELNRERLRTYFPEDGREKRVLQALHRYLRSLKKITPEFPRVQMKTASLPEQDWGENWKRYFKPVWVTSRLVVKPPWSRVRLKKGQISIDIIPGMAFGTGTHATTQLCLQALAEWLPKKEAAVLDVGTGSGILSILSSKLGAREVWGVDADKVAVENARENIEQNRVGDRVKIIKGRIGDLKKKFDVIVANIDFKNLRKMRRPLLNHLKRQGLLILSGILEREEGTLRELYLKTGQLQWIKMAQKEEWVCFTFKKK